jgi:hypothetical protein
LEQQPLKNAVLQGFILKNRKSLQAQAWSKSVRFSAQSISFGTGSFYNELLHRHGWRRSSIAKISGFYFVKRRPGRLSAASNRRPARKQSVAAKLPGYAKYFMPHLTIALRHGRHRALQ